MSILTSRYDARLVVAGSEISNRESKSNGKAHFLVAPSIIQNGIDYYSKRGKVDKANLLADELENMKGLLTKIHTRIFQKAMDLADEYHDLDDHAQLHERLEEHLKKHIKIFSDKHLKNDAEELQKHLSTLKKNKNILGCAEIKSFFYNLLHGERTSSLPNQVYRVKTVFGKDRFPGQLERKSGDVATGDAEIDNVYNFGEYAERFALSALGIHFVEVLGGRPKISTVGVKMDNAYWDGKQIVTGQGQVLFNNLASTLPGSLSVILHEWFHAVTEFYTGRFLKKKGTGLDYDNGDSGALNEALSDIAAISYAVTEVEEGRVVLSLSDERAGVCFKIGLGLWRKGEKGDALRDASTGMGWDPNGKLAEIVGPPDEHYYMDYANWHTNDGSILNNPVIQNWAPGEKDSVDPHKGSACPLAVFVKQLALLKNLNISAKTACKIWYDTIGWSVHNVKLPSFGDNMVEVVQKMESDLGLGDRPESAIRESFMSFHVPLK